MNFSKKIQNLTSINPYSFIDKNLKNKNQIALKKNLSLNSSKRTSKNKNVKYLKNIDDINSELNKTTTKFRKINLFNEILSPESNIDNILKFLLKELSSINSEKYINDIVKMFEIFQEELIIQLENKYNNLKINKIMKKNFEIIIKYILNFFSIYQNKYKDCITLIKNKMNYITKRGKSNKSIINNYTNNNNNFIIFEENIKKYFLNQEENVVNLINSLSSAIKTYNSKYKLILINIENNLDSYNNKLIEIKNKLSSINTKTFNYNIKTKILNYEEINIDIEKIYLTNINLNKEIKLLDKEHKLFLEEAKEIFNHLRINHKIKIKKYQKLFDSFNNDKKNKEKLASKNKSEIKYFKINFSKLKRTRNISNNMNNYMNKTINKTLNKNNLYLKLNNSQNSSNNNNSFDTTSTLQNKKININSIYKQEDNNIEIYYISQLMLEFFDKLKILQKAIINKEPNVNILKKEFEKYKREIIKYLKNLMNKSKGIGIIKYHIMKVNNICIISNIKNCEDIHLQNKLFKDILFKFLEYIYSYLNSKENIIKEISKENINKIDDIINKFFDKVKKDIEELKDTNDKLNIELNKLNNIQKNIISKKSLIFDSGKDLSLSFRDKNIINDVNNKINSIEEEDTNDKNNMTGTFKKEENLNINEDIINLQINLENKVKYLEKEVETEKNNNLNVLKELKLNEKNIQYSNFVKLYEEELSNKKNLEEKYISEIVDINNNLKKYFQKIKNEENIINPIENKNIKNNSEDLGHLNFDYNLNISLAKVEIKELNNKIKEKEEKINELKQKIKSQDLILKEKLYKPLRNEIESLITEIKLDNKIKDILKKLLKISLYNDEEIEKIFEYKEKNINILGLYKL